MRAKASRDCDPNTPITVKAPPSEPTSQASYEVRALASGPRTTSVVPTIKPVEKAAAKMTPRMDARQETDSRARPAG